MLKTSLANSLVAQALLGAWVWVVSAVVWVVVGVVEAPLVRAYLEALAVAVAQKASFGALVAITASGAPQVAQEKLRPLRISCLALWKSFIMDQPGR
jgi:hypothetical protein